LNFSINDLKRYSDVPPQNSTKEISDFIVGASHALFPKEVVVVAKRSVLDWIAVTPAAMKEKAAKIVVRFVKETDGEVLRIAYL
jgi:2-methylcitrate dehydratase PrpD